MAKKANENTGEKGSKSSDFRKSGKKFVVLIAMILLGILLILYKSNYEYWSDQFVAYNQYLFIVSLILMILMIVMIVLNIKTIFKHELIGTFIFSMGVMIVCLFLARQYFDLGMGDDGIIFYALGGIVMAIGTIFLMRTGGFIGAGFVGIIVIMLLSMVHMMDTRDIVQYDNNALQMINVVIVCMIASFISMLYHDLKFFYLAKLMRDQRELRGKKDYSSALKYCDKALKVYPFFVTGLNNKGNVLVNMGKKEDAVKCYKKALSINPDYSPAIKNLKMLQ